MYATIDDMIRRFGADEMIRLTTPASQELDAIVRSVADAALEDASAVMDSYIRRRYRTPLDVPPPEVRQKCCDMARYGLSTGDQKTCSEEVRTRHKDALDWLRDVAQGRVTLDLDEVTPGDESYAVMQTRGAREAPYGCGEY